MIKYMHDFTHNLAHWYFRVAIFTVLQTNTSSVEQQSSKLRIIKSLLKKEHSLSAPKFPRK